MSISRSFLRTLAGAALALLAAAPGLADEHPSSKRVVNLPPSVDLQYTIKARQRGFSLSGEAFISWRAGDGKYSIVAETRATLLGTILHNRSEGAIDAFGIAPATFYEKRLRHDPDTTTFNRDSRTITFTDGVLSYPIKGGEQDRSSAPWQLAATARGAPEKFVAGSEWTYFVAGRRDAESWTFKVLGAETLRTRMGEHATVHLIKAPPPDSAGQQLDIWLAPGLEWYPVRLRFTDGDGEMVEQTLERIVRK